MADGSPCRIHVSVTGEVTMQCSRCQQYVRSAGWDAHWQEHVFPGHFVKSGEHGDGCRRCVACGRCVTGSLWDAHEVAHRPVQIGHPVPGHGDPFGDFISATRATPGLEVMHLRRIIAELPVELL